MQLDVTDSTPSRALSIDQIAVGDTVTQTVIFDAKASAAFACLARDSAPIHENGEFARQHGFDEPIIQGLAVVGRFSRLMGMYLPGEHAVLQKVEFKFHQPVFAGRAMLYSCKIQRIVRPLRVVALEVAVSATGVNHVTGQCQCLLL